MRPISRPSRTLRENNNPFLCTAITGDVALPVCCVECGAILTDQKPTFASLPPLKGHYLVRSPVCCRSQQCAGKRQVFRPVEQSIQYVKSSDISQLRQSKAYGSLYRKLEEIFVEKRADVYLTVEETNTPSKVFKRK